MRIRVLCAHRSLGDICPPAHRSYAFLDINPLARGHALVIPKCPVFYIKRSLLGLTWPFLNVFFWAVVDVVDHAVKMHELPDEYLADAMPIAKKIAIAQGAENYNILQVGARRPPLVGGLLLLPV